MTSSHPWLGWSNPPLPLYPFCFPCRTLWPRAKHLLSVVTMHQRKLAEVGAEKLSGQTKNLDADAAKCANIADVFAAVDAKQQTGWRRRGGWAVESTTGKLGKRQRAANSNSGCSCENVGATWTPKLSCFAIYRSGSKNQGNNTMNVQNMALVKDCYHQPNIYFRPPCFSFTWCNSDFFSCCSDSRAFTWMFPVWKTSLIVLTAHEQADTARRDNAVLMVCLSWGTKPTLVRVSRRSCFGSKYQMVS